MLKKITFTGIDNETKAVDLLKLQDDFPIVEFGMLISETNTGTGKKSRYPDLSILKNVEGSGLHLSMHVCGKLARDIIHKNDWDGIKRLAGEYWECFQRIQLNVAGECKFSKEIQFPDDKEIILQFRRSFLELYAWYRDIPNIAGFMDNSGGQGILETAWTKTNDKWFGYAGGINEENVVDVVKTINSINSNDYWIDMESSLRTDDRFDISICRRICEKLKKKGLV